MSPPEDPQVRERTIREAMARERMKLPTVDNNGQPVGPPPPPPAEGDLQPEDLSLAQREGVLRYWPKHYPEIRSWPAAARAYLSSTNQTPGGPSA